MAFVSFNKDDYAELVASLRQVIREELNYVRQTELTEKLYAPVEACKVFHPPISRVTLRKWTLDGRITQQKIGGRVFYKYSELLEAGARLKRYKK